VVSHWVASGSRTKSKRRLQDRFDLERRGRPRKKGGRRGYVETVWSWFEGEMIVVMNMNGIVEQNIGLRPYFSLRLTGNILVISVFMQTNDSNDALRSSARPMALI